MSKNKPIVITSIALLVAATAIGVGAAINGNSKKISDTTSSSTITTVTTNTDTNTSETTPIEDILDNEDWSNTVVKDGKTYKLREDIRTILFMGIDSDVDVDYNGIAGGGGRADTVLLFVVDETNKTMDILEISRDTIIEVDVYNFDRDLLYTGDMQLCMQYSFSDNSKRSCLLMKDKVSNLIFGNKIDNYCSLTVTGMSNIVDAMGGIEITFDDDYTYIDSRYSICNTVTLDSKDVNAFVRYRDTDKSGSNNDRMDRQGWFLKELFTQMSKSGASNLISLYDAAGDHLCTDMDAEELKDLSSVTLGNIYKVPGNSVEGNFHDEYYIDSEGLRSILIDLLYEEI